MQTDRLNALDVALDNEMSEREFYLKHAERTTSPVGRAMFRQLADEEQEHYERLGALHAAWEKDGRWPETVPLKVSDTIVGDTLKKVLAEVDRQPTADDDDLAAVREAIAFEARGVAHYGRLRDASTDPREYDFFALLANIENEHLASLRETEEFFLDPAAWYRRTEHNVLDGA
ncbi:MAG: ferritin family protein [Deltaproteobacteria bacterium]|nr:ferritin family protein [Candidatus Anaeroferrophillacea bacterium]